jgi:hypothetical protein
MGWREERFIYGAIERLQGLKINRIRCCWRARWTP